MDAEDCEPFTDVYWIKFQQVNNARFAKRKLDESVFLGNQLKVSYAPQYESLLDTKAKLEARRSEVLARLNPRRSKALAGGKLGSSSEPSLVLPRSQTSSLPYPIDYQQRDAEQSTHNHYGQGSSSIATVSSNKDFFDEHSMNQTVQLVREKLNKIQSSAGPLEAGTSKKLRVDNRRRI